LNFATKPKEKIKYLRKNLEERIKEFFKTKRGKSYIKIFISVLIASIITSISLKITNQKYQKEIEKIKQKIEIETSKKDTKKIREEYQKYKEIITIWEISKDQNKAIYEFLILISKAVNEKIQINEISISAQDSLKINFAITGITKQGQSLKSFSSKLNKQKKNKILVKSEITEIQKENDKIKFRISGNFSLK